MSSEPHPSGTPARPRLNVRPRLPAPKGYRRLPVSLRWGLPIALLGVLVVQLWPQIQSLFQGFFPAYARFQVFDAVLRHPLLSCLTYSAVLVRVDRGRCAQHVFVDAWLSLSVGPSYSIPT